MDAISAPFEGFTIDTEWGGWMDVTGKKYLKRMAAGTHFQFKVGVRLEPEGDLEAFGYRMAGVLGRPVGMPIDGDRSIWLLYECVAKDARGAVSSCSFWLDRKIRKVGTPIRRMSWDTLKREEAKDGNRAQA